MSNYLKRFILPCFLAFSMPAAAMAQPAADTADSEQARLTVTSEALLEAYRGEAWGRVTLIARELLKSEPENVEYLSMLGVACAQNNENECARDAFEKVRDLKPEDAQVYANLCAVYSEIRFEDRIETCLEATNRLPDNAPLLFLTGRKLEALKRSDEARQKFEAAWRIDPQNNVYLTAVTAIDFSKRDFKSALEITEEGIQFGNVTPILYLNAIVAALHIGDYEKAIRHANAGYEKYKDPVMMLGKAEALDRLGRFDEASPVWEILRVTMSADPLTTDRFELALANHLLATSCTQESFKSCVTDTPDGCCARESEALERLDAVSEPKRDSSYQVKLGIALTLADRLDKAEAVLTKAVNASIDRENAGALAALAVALYHYSDERDKTAAKRYYTQAVNASPDFADFDRLTRNRAWPPRFVETLRQIKADVDAGDKKKPTGCGCDISRTPVTPTGAMLMAGIFLLGLAIKRRRS